jgi:mitochondrial fission protein ELM1
MRTWILTDGKAGDEAQCLGVAEHLGYEYALKYVAPRRPWVWAMPWGPVDPAEHPSRSGSPIAPPFPDLLIASGRRTVPYTRLIQRLNPRTFTVFLKDPRTGPSTADLIWVPEHDKLHGPNVIRSLTSPHRISAQRLDHARRHPPRWLTPLPAPRAALLLGGDSAHHTYTDADIHALIGKLEHLCRSGVSVMITASRRTPLALREAAAGLLTRYPGWMWDGTGENPYLSMLAHADCIVVTADSVNMVGEAVSTGLPVFVFEPSGNHRKIRFFLDSLLKKGVICPFNGLYEPYEYNPLDSTPCIAAAILAAMNERGNQQRM